MGKYVLKRFASMMVTLFLIATVTFFLMRLIPGDPFELPRDTPQVVRENLEQKYGLDKPLMEQYVIYLKNLLHGDFGASMKYKGQTVIGKVATGMPVSAIIGFGGVILGAFLGAILGCIAALKNKGFVDYAVMILAIVGVSIPSFVFGSLIQKIFGVDLKIFPIQGWKGWEYAVLPMLTACFTNIAFYARMLRSSMLDVMKQDYIFTARSKGLTETEIVKGHMLRNSLLPLVTSFGPMCAGILTGNFVVEQIFNIPGIGQAMINAIQGSDYTMILGLTLIFSFISAVMYFVVDVLYGVVDPRIRVAS